MAELKIGVQVASLRLPLQQALRTATRLGATAVELDARHALKPQEMSDTALRQVRKWLADGHLSVSAVSYFTRRGYNVADDLDARIAGTKAAMRLAATLGARVLVNHVGLVPSKPEGPEWSLLVQVLDDLGRFGQHVGTTLAAQTGSESGPELARLIQALPEGAVGVDLDPANLIVNGHSPLEAAQALGNAIVHVHVTDAVRDLARGRGLEVSLGRGTADFPALLAALEERNYRGYFTIAREASGDPVAEIGNAIEYLRSL